MARIDSQPCGGIRGMRDRDEGKRSKRVQVALAPEPGTPGSDGAIRAASGSARCDDSADSAPKLHCERPQDSTRVRDERNNGSPRPAASTAPQRRGREISPARVSILC